MQGDLSQLSGDKIVELMGRYYKGEAAKKLISEFDLNVLPTHLYKLFPPEAFPEYNCDFCGSVLVADRRSKSMGKSPIYRDSLYCPCCGHKPYTICKCNNCIQAEMEQQNERQKNISESFGKQPAQIEFENLSFVEKVYLGSISRAYLRENLSEIAPSNEKNVVLAPSSNFCSEIYRTLSRANAIAVSPLSSSDAFVFDDDNRPKEYYINKVIYNLNLKCSDNKKAMVTEILNPTFYSPSNQDEALALWRKIAIAECVEYLDYNLHEVGFEFSPGEKTYAILEILLNDFSVSQIYGMIYKAVANASKLCLARSMTKRHAANTVIGSCERFAERALINHWDLTRYSRIRDLPQSILSEFFFNRVLGIGDMGFDMAPTVV